MTSTPAVSKTLTAALPSARKARLCQRQCSPSLALHRQHRPSCRARLFLADPHGHLARSRLRAAEQFDHPPFPLVAVLSLSLSLVMPIKYLEAFTVSGREIVVREFREATLRHLAGLRPALMRPKRVSLKWARVDPPCRGISQRPHPRSRCKKLQSADSIPQ